MIISKSNIAKDATITVLPVSATNDISVIADGDYSSTYTSTLTSTVIEFAFASPQIVEYVSFGASNISQKNSVTIETSAGLFNYDGDLSKIDATSLFYTAQVNDHSAVTSVTITIAGSGQLKIAEVAMGEILEIEQGEQSGYSRAWSVPNIQTRSPVNLVSAPISVSYEARELSVTLTVSKYIMEVYESEWYEMLRFASINTFYVREDDNPSHSYAGFNAKPTAVKADGQSPKLGAVSIKFNAYSKGVL